MSTTFVTSLRLIILIKGRWAVGGVFEAESPNGTAKAVDRPVLKDALSTAPTAYLPPASLVGSLREHLGDEGSYWFGSPIEGASKLRALGTKIDETNIAVTSRTRIDASRRAPVAGALWSEESAGQTDSETRVEWHLQYDGQRDETLETKIAEWLPQIGRGISIGMGEAEVTSIESVTTDLQDIDHLTWWLNDRALWYDGAPASECNLPKDLTVHVVKGRPRDISSDLEWTFVTIEPLRVGTGEKPKGESAPLLTSGGKPLLPGSSWKGLFAHRVAHILRVRGEEGITVLETIERLFGADENESERRTGRRGALRFYDSIVHDNSVNPSDKGERTHVAIDRFTGGAAPSLLYAEEVVRPGATLTLRIGGELRTGSDRELLKAVIADLNDGIIGVGGSTTRGYGSIRTIEQSENVS